jgi:hypothetical protein
MTNGIGSSFIQGLQSGQESVRRGERFELDKQQAAQRSALADLALEQKKQQFATQQQQQGVSDEMRRIQFMNQAGKALLNISPQQRVNAFQRLLPAAETVGIPAGVFTPDQLTDENLNQLITSTSAFIQNPQRLEQAKLQLRERELEQRKELALQRPELRAEEERQKLEAQRGIKAEVAGEVERAKGAAKTASDAIDKSFQTMGKVQTNINNINRAISALDRGAKTGAIERFLPSIRSASRELDQIRSELGLDIIGAVTFGALSEGELQLALDTALPTGLNEPELKDFLIRKREAQGKTLKNLQEAIQFLEAGGTVGEFIQSKQVPVQDRIESIPYLSDEDLFKF